MIHAIPAQARRGWVLPTLAVAAVMGVALGRFTLAGGGIAPPLSLRPGGGGAEAAIGDLQARLGATPDDPTLLTRLGEAYLLRARETADPSWFTMAGQALDRSQALAPDRPATLTGLGLLALAATTSPPPSRSGSGPRPRSAARGLA